jgi:hypothetical protein
MFVSVRGKQQIYEPIRFDSCETTELRRARMAKFGCTQSQFDSALKELPMTLSIVRSNEPEADRDKWLPFQEIYRGIYQEHHPES